MSETTGQKPIDLKIEITINKQDNTIAIVPDRKCTIGEILQVLSAAYNAVEQTGKEMVDKPVSQMVH